MKPFKRKPKVDPIRISGIYTVASRLRLPKSGFPQAWISKPPLFLVAMQSGRDAVFVWSGYEHGWNVDWGWHVLSWKRWAKPEDANLLRYC